MIATFTLIAIAAQWPLASMMLGLILENYTIQ